MRDVDTGEGLLFVEQFKGRARWVPFHSSLSRELDKYVLARRAFAAAEPGDRFFVGANHRRLPVETAAGTIRKLFQKAGLKPSCGRVGPRPYDFRHRADSPVMPIVRDWFSVISLFGASRRALFAG
jgi:integrase